MTPKYPGCKCDVCPLKDRQIVPPSGDPDAKILFIGQAPARIEVQRGRPFSGPSGLAFDSALEEHGIKREDVRVDNAVLCYWEAGERPPREAVEACRGHLDLDTPQVIVPMGNDALGVVTGVWDGILSISGICFSRGNQKVVPLTHPAFYLRTMPGEFRSFKDGIGLVCDLISSREYDHIGSTYRLIDTKESALALLKGLAESPPDNLVVDLETNQPDVPSATILCIALAWDDETGYVIPWSSEYLEKHESGSGGVLEDWDVYEALKSALEAAPNIVCHNAPFDVGLLLRENINCRIKDDTLLQHYALDERTGSQGLKAIARHTFGLPDWEEKLKEYVPRKEDPFDLIPPDILFPYAAKDACVTWALRERQEAFLSLPHNEGPKRYYDNVLMRVCRVLVKIISRGVKMDLEKIKQALQEMPAHLDELEKQLQEMSGKGWMYTPGSVPDNRDVLFNKFQLPNTKNGSTDKTVLEALAGHPFVDLLVEYRQYQKVCNTYMVNLAYQYREGRGHPDFKQFGTVTSRLSANKLNPLIFPRESRGDLYSAVKEVFVADDDCFLMQSDYSGMELRLWQVQSGDQWLYEVLSDPRTDFHGRMGQEIYVDYGTFDADRRKEARVIAKMLVFGIGFGREAKSISLQLGCSQKKTCLQCQQKRLCRRALKEAMELLTRFFAPMPMYVKWRKDQVKLAHTRGYLEDQFGRRRRFDLITNENVIDVDKQCYNNNIQGTANIVNLLVMCDLEEKTDGLVRPLWPIHDSILMNVRRSASESDVQAILKLIRETPQKLLNTTLPFYIEVDVGHRWGQLKAYVKDSDPDFKVPLNELLQLTSNVSTNPVA